MIKTVEFKKRTIELISKKKVRIGIIGLGYVGLPLALLFAKKGFKIFGFDNDNKKINSINKNQSYIERISNKNITLLNKKGNKCFSDYKRISECDIIIICVPTPLKNKNIPDLLYANLKDISKYIKQGQTIILESTDPEQLKKKLLKINKIYNRKNFFVGFSSEKLIQVLMKIKFHLFQKL